MAPMSALVAKLTLLVSYASFTAAAGGWHLMERSRLSSQLSATDRRPRWEMRMPDSRERQVALTFAVKQANVEELERLLLDVSTPGSSLRGEFLSYGAAHNFTANPGASDRVLAWLTSAGATIAYVHRYGHFIRAVASVAQWEAALNTHFVALFNPHAPHLSVHHRAASDVFVPLSLSEDLEGIFDATHPPIKPHLHPS